MDPPRELIETLAGAVQPVMVSHVSPDADALGSILALARAVPVSKAAVAFTKGTINQRLQFMLELARSVPVADPDRLTRADVVAVCDTAGTNRVNIDGKWDAIADKIIANIDHHISNPDFGRHNWVVDNASSTCELIYRLIRSAGWPLDPGTATLLYAGIYSDTGGFSLPNVTADSFDAAASLVRAGANVELVGARLMRSQQQSEFDLVRLVYHNTKIAADGRIAYSTLDHNEIESTGCTMHDIDDQVSIPRSLSGIKIAIFFSEGEPGVIRINLRGEEGTAILTLSRSLGGGGHTFSAGARIRGEMSEVVDRVLREAAAALDDIS